MAECDDPKLGEEFTKSPYDYWQFWRNTEDADVGRFLRLFTELPLSEIEKLEALEGADINQAKIRLANEATTLLHGSEAAREAEETARKTFAEGGSAAGLPTFDVSGAELDGMLAIDAAIIAGLAASKGEARRHIKGNALKINDVKVADDRQTLSLQDLNDGVIKISVGKKAACAYSSVGVRFSGIGTSTSRTSRTGSNICLKNPGVRADSGLTDICVCLNGPLIA